MQTFTNLYPQLCSYENLELAFNKAKKGKSGKANVQKFEANKEKELYKLEWELQTNTYQPGALTSFIVRDPKTRRISAAPFRDRVVHHAICNMIEPIYEARFIHDTFANRIGKGTSGALQRFDKFVRKVCGPSDRGYVLKADIRKYFENVDHEVLLKILKIRIKDQQLLGLVRIILKNHKTDRPGKGMPLGNLTSQFFANVYLAELDHFVKHELRAKHYLRYVDDFVIVSRDKEQLETWRARIAEYITTYLHITLHPDKTKIIQIRGGVPLVGFRVFRHHKLLKPSNRKRAMRRFQDYREGVLTKVITREHVRLGFSGWEGYAKMGNTFRLRENVRGQLEGIL